MTISERKSRIHELDVQGIMERYTPSIFNFITLNDLEPIVREKLTIKLKKRLGSSLVPGASPDFDMYREGDFYDLLYVTTRVNDPNSEQVFVINMIDMLKGINELFFCLNQMLSPEQKLLIKETTLKIFRNTVAEYIHYVGELLGLYNLIVKGYHLKSVSQTFGGLDEDEPNNAEFLVSKDGNDYLFEMYNARITTSKSAMFKRKLQRKLNRKLSKGIEDESKFFLQPIVWCKRMTTIMELAKEVDYMGDRFKIQNVCEPFSFFLFRPDGKTTWKIVRFSEMLDMPMLKLGV